MRAAVRLGPSRDLSQAGSSGARSGFEVAVGGATFEDFAFVLDREVASREARGELASPSDRAASMSARAAVRDGKGSPHQGQPELVGALAIHDHPRARLGLDREALVAALPASAAEALEGPRLSHDAPVSAMRWNDAAGSLRRHRRRCLLPVRDREREVSQPTRRPTRRRCRRVTHPRHEVLGLPLVVELRRPALGSVSRSKPESMNGGSCDAVHDVVVHDPDAVVAPAEVLLADEALDGRRSRAAGAGSRACPRRRHFSVPAAVAAWNWVIPAVSAKSRPAADQEEAAEVGRRGELVLHQLLAQLGVVVAEERRHVLEAVWRARRAPTGPRVMRPSRFGAPALPESSDVGLGWVVRP